MLSLFIGKRSGILKPSKEYVDDYSKGKLYNGVLPVLSNGITVDEFKVTIKEKVPTEPLILEMHKTALEFLSH